VRVLLLLMCLLVPLRAGAIETQLQAIIARKVLRVGMVPGLVPFTAAGEESVALRKRVGEGAPAAIISKNGQPISGLDVELADAAAKALGVTLEIYLEPHLPEVLDGVRSGKYDVAIAGITATLERARTIRFSDAYFASGLVVLERQRDRFAELSQLKKTEIKVAYRAGTTAEEFVKTELAGCTPVPIASDEALHAAMDDPKIADAVVTDWVAARDAQVRGLIKATLHPVEGRRFNTESFAFAVRPGDTDWVAWLNLFIRQTRTSGAFHRMAARYNAWFRTER
jgi:polar amino acid transport system substrate-binding protein